MWEDLNFNGVQDSGENGLEGVYLELYTGGDEYVNATTTDANGLYLFENVAPGSYYVRFYVPEGDQFTFRNVGNDALDSDADRTTGDTEVFTIDPDQDDMTRDAGMVPTGGLGGYVWFDTDQDGIFESDEFGNSNITVRLYDASNTVVATTLTQENGFYSFIDLFPGNYHVGFVPPSGFIFTLQDQGTDEFVDSDADPGTGLTVVTTIAPAEFEYYWGAGIYGEPERTEPTPVPPVCGSISGIVYEDANQNGTLDAGERGIKNVKVTLKLGQKKTQVKTDENGRYAFDNAARGKNKLSIKLPKGMKRTTGKTITLKAKQCGPAEFGLVKK